MITRRELLAGAAVAAPLSAKAPRIGRDRISAITDEIARTPEAAIAFAKQYGLSFLELRAVPGVRGEYALLPEEKVRETAKQLSDAGVRISFLNTSLLKFTWPGTAYIRQREETAEVRTARLAREQLRWDRRFDDLNKAIRAAQILGTTKVRVFAGMRVAEPESLYPRIIDTLGEYAKIAEKEKIWLLLENEAACNIGTSAELAAVINKLPKAIGINWDPLNGEHTKEKAYPDGYALLPKKRIGNVQIKGMSVLPGAEWMDWGAIFGSLERDGYRGHVGLETHIFGEIQVAKSHESIKEILRIVDSRAT